jgi:hypothetical protein
MHREIGRRSALPVDLARLGWATLLLAAPDAALAATGATPTRLRRAVVRVLGARHAIEATALIALRRSRPLPAALDALPPEPVLRSAGAAADVAHAVSAFALAATGRVPATWFADGAVASAFATATWRSRDE